MTVAEGEMLRQWFRACAKDHAGLADNAESRRRLRASWEWLALKRDILAFGLAKKIAWDEVNAIAAAFRRAPGAHGANDLVLTGDPAPVVRERKQREKPRRADPRQGRLL